MRCNVKSVLCLIWLVMSVPFPLLGAELIPPLEQIKQDRPRIFLRPAELAGGNGIFLHLPQFPHNSNGGIRKLTVIHTCVYN